SGALGPHRSPGARIDPRPFSFRDRVNLFLVLEQALNGLQLGVMLFLMAAGLTLVFGIMNLVNLAHGSFYMVGAYLATYFYQATGSWLLGVLLGLAGTLPLGALVPPVAVSQPHQPSPPAHRPAPPSLDLPFLITL